MRRFFLVFVLAPLLVGFPTNARASTSSNTTSVDDIVYWSGNLGDQRSDCALNPDKLWLCIEEVYLDGRKLEFKPSNELMNSNTSYVQITGSTTYFQCWAPTWRKPKTFTTNTQSTNRELCSYSQFSVYFSQHIVISETVQPRLSVKIRKMAGDFPGTHLGFLNSPGPVHEFTPASDTNEYATLTISPGLTYSAGFRFNLELHNYEPPEFAQGSPQWSYSFFLATAKVTGPWTMSNGFEMLPESSGAWDATNASSWGFYGDYKTPEYAIRVAGPHYHYKADPFEPDVLNTSWFSSYMPRALVQRQFGITPEQANETNIEVTRSVGRNPTQLPSTFTATDDGLLIQTDGITFSKPVISIRRKIVVKRNKSLSPASIINAAGIPKSERRTARIQTNPCRNSRKGCTTTNSKFIFRKKGTYTFSVSYRTRDARKKPLVKRSRVTVNVN